MAVNYIPQDYHTVTPYLVCEQAEATLDFITKAFGAKVGQRFNGPDGKLMHCEVTVGDSKLMVGQASGQMQALKCMLYLYFPNADEVYKKGVAAGGEAVQEVKDQFYGDRAGCLKDASGNTWWVATHIEEVSDEEIRKRMAAMGKPTGTASSAAAS
jgi:uncharacterized glyoxalase superfamily protein PhnB